MKPDSQISTVKERVIVVFSIADGEAFPYNSYDIIARVFPTMTRLGMAEYRWMYHSDNQCTIYG